MSEYDNILDSLLSDDINPTTDSTTSSNLTQSNAEYYQNDDEQIDMIGDIVNDEDDYDEFDPYNKYNQQYTHYYGEHSVSDSDSDTCGELNFDIVNEFSSSTDSELSDSSDLDQTEPFERHISVDLDSVDEYNHIIENSVNNTDNTDNSDDDSDNTDDTIYNDADNTDNADNAKSNICIKSYIGNKIRNLYDENKEFIHAITFVGLSSAVLGYINMNGMMKELINNVNNVI